jgi:Ca2+-binding RTX toxin-like protein
MNARRVRVGASIAVVSLGLAVVAGLGPARPEAGQVAKCDGKRATIERGGGDNAINGTPQADVIVAGAGDDSVQGFEGNDRICLGAGDDIGGGGEGRDTLVGGGDADLLEGGGGADRIRLGGGNDSEFVTTNPFSPLYQARGAGDSGNDKVGGGAGDDLLSGAEGTDALNGNAGTDECDAGKEAGDTEKNCEA